MLARRTLGALLALGVAAGLAIAAPAPALAQGSSVVVSNGFEGVDGNRWTFASSGNPGSTGFVERNSPHPHTGVSNGALVTGSGPASSAAAARLAVDLRSLTPSHICQAAIFVQTPGARLSMFVLDGTGRDSLAGLSERFVSTGSQYQLLQTPEWRVGPWSGVTFGITVADSTGSGSWARIDNLIVACRLP